jgi:phosphoglycolate phosphatase
MKIGKAIIWDWNGTLLDDTEICINGINTLLKARQLQLLDTSRYKEIFTFPVRDYYEKAGFDFSREPFDVPAMQFIDFYRDHIVSASLFPEVVDTLRYFKKAGFRQSVLSAMENGFLHQSIREKGIYQYFELIAGINDHFADSKTIQAQMLIKKMNVDPDQTTIIGDTIHDYEVAQEIGCGVLLIANGHQSADRLKKLDCQVINNLSEVKKQLS